MKNKSIIYAIIAVVILGAIWLVIPKTPSNPTDADNPRPGNTSNGKTSLRDLMALGKSQKCTFQVEQDGVASSGAVYVNGNKIRGDFETTVANKKESGHMISDDSFIYIWTEGAKQGIKMEAAKDNSGINSDVPTNEVLDMDADYEYNCSAWTAQTSMFTAPAGVTFTDLSSFGSTTLPDLGNLKF